MLKKKKLLLKEIMSMTIKQPDYDKIFVELETIVSGEQEHEKAKKLYNLWLNTKKDISYAEFETLEHHKLREKELLKALDLELKIYVHKLKKKLETIEKELMIS